MNNDSKEYVLLDAVTPQTLTSSTNASPTVITKTSHGLATGDRILIFGHTTNTNANGLWDVVRVDANTFKIKDINTGVEVNANGVGADGIALTAPKVPLAVDFRNAVLQISTSGSFNGTIKLVGSQGKADGSCPNFGATASVSNPWTYVESVDLADGSSVAGATGVASAGTDIIKNLEFNTNTLKYLSIIVTAWSAGAITARLILTNNK